MIDDIKWLWKRCALIFLILLTAAAAIILRKRLPLASRPLPAAGQGISSVLVKSYEGRIEREGEVVDFPAETSEESAYWQIPQARDCLISEEEREELQERALSAAKSVSGMNGSSGERVAAQLGDAGLVSAAEGSDMHNHEWIEKFYADYLKGQDSMVTVFEVRQDGELGAVNFIYREGEIQTYYIGIRWEEDGAPKVQGTSVSDVAEMKLTEKGYFIYAFETVIAHGSLRQYWRIRPLSEECRRLTEKYISGLSYVNYNMLVTDWDSGNVEDILMPCMFEDIYRIHTGEIFQAKDGRIPAEEYERIMMAYFPVSAGQLRENCRYDEGSKSYEYEMLHAQQYPPFGEVVDYKENGNGTITLTVDGVWPDYNSDYAFTNRLVIKPSADGTFRYLSNHIEEKELEIPRISR